MMREGGWFRWPDTGDKPDPEPLRRGRSQENREAAQRTKAARAQAASSSSSSRLSSGSKQDSLRCALKMDLDLADQLGV